MGKNFKQFIAILIVFFTSINLWFFSFSFVLAEDEHDDPNLYYKINLDQPTIAKGYTVVAFEDELKLSLVPGILSEDTDVEIVQLHESLPTPWQLDKVSKFYQFEFKNKAAYDDHKPFYIQFSYGKSSNNHKQVYFYDKNFASWRPLPTRDFPQEKFVRSLIHLPYARIAVFSYPNIMTVGKASWYAYKPGNFAASPDFPKGSMLRVRSAASGKYVDVEINDFGPERHLFPDRAIDLEKNAFASIAPLGAGTINIEIEPLYIAPDTQGRVLGISESGISQKPQNRLKAAIVMEEETGKVLWAKQATTTLPIASLTKMVAMKVFLDTKPSLNNIVAYSTQDEEYNYQHVKKWESARLRVEEGDSMTIEDLVYASLVGSANNTIETLVRVSSLSRDAFMQKMNTSVQNWGASSTHFIEPTGLAPENVSSAQDYAIISREVLKHPIIQKASTMTRYKLNLTNREKTFNISNTNHIIKTNLFRITGSKTGYLDESGYCLMVRVKANNGKSIIIVTLGAESRDISFYETTDLIEFGLRKL